MLQQQRTLNMATRNFRLQINVQRNHSFTDCDHMYLTVVYIMQKGSSKAT